VARLLGAFIRPVVRARLILMAHVGCPRLACELLFKPFNLIVELAVAFVELLHIVIDFLGLQIDIQETLQSESFQTR